MPDLLVPKAPKRFPLVLRTVVLAFGILCGLYIFYMTKRNLFREFNLSQIKVIDNIGRPCSHIQIEEQDIHYVHFPDPETFSRQECSCNPVCYFAIVSMQRSGSGWFETLLNSHVNVSSNGEILGASIRRSNISVILKTLDRVYNLDWFSSASKNECSAVVGFKWMLNQGLMVHHEVIVDYFNKKGVSLIFLFRRNQLRRMVSLLANIYDKKAKILNGTHKSHVHSPQEAKQLARYRPTLNTTILVSNLRSAENTIARALEYYKSTRHILLYYEDVVANQSVRDNLNNDVFQWLQKLVDVQDFLKIPRQNLTSFQVKIHTGPLSIYIKNWDGLQKTLKGTSYEQYIKID